MASQTTFAMQLKKKKNNTNYYKPSKMEKKIIDLAKAVKPIDPAALLSFIEVETGGRGFDQATGKIIIQFEPVWFKRKAPFAPSGKWSLNKVERQAAEWAAFNDAFAKNPDAAMQATSIGLGQIMGFHYKRLGYDSVGSMWDDAKTGIEAQFDQILKFITTDPSLCIAITRNDWDKVATIYNGKNYKELARKIPREPYNISLEKAYHKYQITNI